jgi:hypothetical protein
MRVGDTGPRDIIQWVSKAWTDHELKLPVFYRETLARLLVSGIGEVQKPYRNQHQCWDSFIH